MASPETDRFEALIIPHLDSAYTLARYILRDEHDAQDAVQDAALRAFRYFGSYRLTRKFLEQSVASPNPFWHPTYGGLVSLAPSMGWQPILPMAGFSSAG